MPRVLVALSMLVLVAALLFAVAAPAFAANGTITGTVRDEAVLPLSGVTATVYQYTGGVWFVIGSTTTGGTGVYSIDVAPGTYSVQFVKATYATQWWDNEPSLWASDDVVVTSGTATTGIDATMVFEPNTTTVSTPALGAGPFAPGAGVTVNWTSVRHYAVGDVFTVWMVNADGVSLSPQYYTVASATATSFSMTYVVPNFPGTDNYIEVAAGPAGGPWDNYGDSPGTFTVTGAAEQSIDVTAPSGTQTYSATDNITVAWTMAQPPFGAADSFEVYVRSASGSSWYQLPGAPTPNPAHVGYTMTAHLSDATPAVPAGTGYQAIVVYRHTGDDPIFGTEAGSFTVTGAALPTLVITQPSISGNTYPKDSPVTVTWTSSMSTLTGQFGVWARTTTGVWSLGQFKTATLGITSYTVPLSLMDMPTGSTCNAIVGYRATPADPWIVWATSTATFNVSAPITPSTATAITGFVVAGQTGSSVIGAGTVTVTMPVGTVFPYTATPTIYVSPGATITPASGASHTWTASGNTQTYLVTAQDGLHTQAWAITFNATAPSTAADILTYVVPGQVGASTIGATTVSFIVPAATTFPYTVTPTITLSSGATVVPASASPVVFGADGASVTYVTTAQDGTTHKTYTVTIHAASAVTGISSFDFNGLTPAVVGTVNNAAHTVALTVPFGTNVTALVPTIVLAGPLATISPASGVAHDFTAPATYTVHASDGTTTQAYTVTVSFGAPSTACLITAFTTPTSYNTDINNGASTVTVTVPAGTVVTALVPTITTSAGATVTPNSGVANNFTAPKTYTVTAQDGVTTKAYTVTVVVAAAPVITNALPLGQSAGGTIALTGTGFLGVSAVTFRQASTNFPATAYTYVNDTSITGVGIPAGLTPGAITITVTTPSGTSATYNYTLI